MRIDNTKVSYDERVGILRRSLPAAMSSSSDDHPQVREKNLDPVICLMVPGKFPANGDGRHLPNQSLMERGSIVCQLATQQVIHETLLRNRRGPFNMAYRIPFDRVEMCH